MKTNCPVCGTRDIEVEVQKSLEERTLFDNTKISFDVEISFCPICEEEFYLSDFDHSFEKARKAKLDFNMREYLKIIKNKFKSVSFIERIFGIPQRTLSRWKEGRYSLCSYALIVLLGKMPWLVEIVEHKFDEFEMEKILHREANRLTKIINPPPSGGFTTLAYMDAGTWYQDFSASASGTAFINKNELAEEEEIIGVGA